MPELVIEPGESLFYEVAPASRSGAPSFVFVNPLIETPMAPGGKLWAQAAALIGQEGYGTLSYDFRGVGRSKSKAETELDPSLLVADLRRIAAQVTDGPPIFVGLGFGALIAAGALLDGESAAGLVMINGLIKVEERIDWLNAAALLLAAEGGPALQMDALLPLLANPDYVAEIRETGAFKPDYQKLSADDPLLNLYRNAAEADWSLPLEDLASPVLVISGLQDRVFLDREQVNSGFERLADARAEAWEDAGHLLPVERPEQLARSLIRFARELDSEASAA